MSAAPPMEVAPAKRRRGWPTKRTALMALRVCRLVADGMPLSHAAGACGISISFLFEWKAKEAAFRGQVEAATSKGIAQRLAVIRECLASQDAALSFRAATWWLEHTQPQHFARNRIEVSGPDGSPLAGVVAIMLPPKQDGNGGQLPTVTVAPALEERTHGNGN